MINPSSVFDILFIGNNLQEKLNDFSKYELHLFCYLSCLMSLYDGNPISYWGYVFIKNELGSPYSKDLDDAINALLSKNSLHESPDGFINITSQGKKELELYSSLKINSHRLIYLQTSSNTIKLLPYGLVKNSILREPLMNSANQHTSKRLLSDAESPAFFSLYEQFGKLKSALNDNYANLLIPAMVWIEYLAQKETTN